jgi:hypothetical protein
MTKTPSTTRHPQFFLAGHPKCGTTAMGLMLEDHPRVFMTHPKEPTFFCPDIQKPWLTDDDYLSLFSGADAEQLAGEASVWYLASRVSAEVIATRYPDAKIILVFREPVSFLRSLHLQMLEVHVETETDFPLAIADAPRRRLDERYLEGLPRTQENEIRKLVYLDHVCYTRQLQRFHRVFPRENVHVVVYDDFRVDNLGTIRSMYRFLGLADHVPSQRAANPTVRLRSPRLHQYAVRVRKGEGGSAALIKSAVRRVVSPSMRSRLSQTAERALTGAPDAVSDSLDGELKQRLTPEVERFSDYLGRDLVSEWGYGRAVDLPQATAPAAAHRIS